MADSARNMGLKPPPTTAAVRRWLPAAVLVGLVAMAYVLGLHRHISLSALAENRDALHGFVTDHLFLALIAYMAIYVLLVALSVPGAAVMSIAGGFLFGWMISVPATITAAVIGSIIVFQIVKTSLGATLAERAGPLVKKVSTRFARDAFHYLLFLRLAPVFPFFMVNAVAGLCRVRLRTFVLATIIGIIPASFAFALLGSGLDEVIDVQLASHQACIAEKGAGNCMFNLDASALLSPELLIAFGGLALVALLPIALKHWRGRPV